ncbi:O-antigen ligase [Clostridium puniceum]|uniref:O-antigen ligase n=1 Tax=Clostridium puniceum TaxID=29367 RepID=A0A1S8TFE4_9CLOT|nr:O-antigen ligase family protein [Clostridium puniceum]OOM76339.1 O-antigen ligase [Clostridium puniceum]
MESIKNTQNKKNINFFFPVAFILAIVPLIVRMTPLTPDQDTLNLFGANSKSDLFSQRKAFLLLIFCVILLGISVVFFKRIFEKRDKVINSILIAASIFLIFTFLSTVFSSYREVAIWGMFDRAEGLITIICYLILLIYSIYAFKTTNDYKYVITPILILVAINAFLGIFQYAGQDLIKTNLGTKIVIPSEYQTPNSKMNLLYEAGKLYGTLFHYNYVGSFVAITLPILFCLTIFEDEDIMHKLSLGIGTLLSVWLLFGSTSRAGIIGIFAATVLGVVIFWKLIIQKWKPLLIFFVSILVIATGLNFATKGSIFERIPTLASDILSVFKDTSDFDYKEHTPVKDIVYTDKDAQVILQNDTLKMSYENNQFIFKNSKDEIVPYVKTDKVYTTTNENFKNITLTIAKMTNKSTRADGIILNINNQPTFTFALKDNNSIHMFNININKDVDIEYPETFGFNGKEKLGSARGYIWSRSIPMIKNNLILGGGPDTFAFRFPQNDLIGKYYAYDVPNMVVDKPHNLYLQIALNNGFIALLAFLAIMIIYIADSVKLYAFKKYYEKPQVFGSVTCLGVVGYLFAGLFNDSVVSVAPVFWIVLGIGIALNYMNRKSLKA